MKKIILAISLLLTTAAQAQVPTYTNSGDLSSVTRHSFVTGKIINPKTSSDWTHNYSLNSQNGMFTTGSQSYHAAGAYVFTMPTGFTKLEVIGCGAGGLAEQHTWWSGVANTGGGGTGSCFRAVLTGTPGSQFLFSPAAANLPTPTQISVAQNNFSRLFALGFNGGRGGQPSFSGGWIDGIPGGGASASEGTKGTYTNITGANPGYVMVPGARLLAMGKPASGWKGAVTTKTYYNNGTYSNYCNAGGGADGIKIGGNAPAAAGNGCVMVKW